MVKLELCICVFPYLIMLTAATVTPSVMGITAEVGESMEAIIVAAVGVGEVTGAVSGGACQRMMTTTKKRRRGRRCPDHHPQHRLR